MIIEAIIKRKRMRRRHFRLMENLQLRSSEDGTIRLLENYGLDTNYSVTLTTSVNLLTLENTDQNLLENGISIALEI